MTDQYPGDEWHREQVRRPDHLELSEQKGLICGRDGVLSTREKASVQLISLRHVREGRKADQHSARAGEAGAQAVDHADGA